jgi:protein-S-isoprenylcysteine O-methyltransferase Ste14
LGGTVSEDPQHALLALAVLGAAYCIASVLYSIFFPSSRTWPIPSRTGPYTSTRRFINRTTGPIIGLSAISLLVVGVLDFGSLRIPLWLHATAGAVLLTAGGALALAGYRTLGADISTGTAGSLEIRGPYRLSRNPQYVGTVGALFGAALVANSWLFLLGAIIWSSWFLLAPIAEEPWLRSLLGSAYEEYASRTRRYL